MTAAFDLQHKQIDKLKFVTLHWHLLRNSYLSNAFQLAMIIWTIKRHMNQPWDFEGKYGVAKINNNVMVHHE